MIDKMPEVGKYFPFTSAIVPTIIFFTYVFVGYLLILQNFALQQENRDLKEKVKNNKKRLDY